MAKMSTLKTDLENELEEASKDMEDDWVEVSDAVEKYSHKDPAAAISGGDDYGLSNNIVCGNNNIISCDVCHLSFSGITPHQQHVLGSKHKKKVVKEAMKKKYGAKYLEVLQNMEESKDDQTVEVTDDGDTAPMVFPCKLCNKVCTGLISHKLHVKGKQHLKQLRKKNLIEKLQENTDFDLGEKTNGMCEDSVYDDMPQVKPYAQCETCNKKFSGPQGLHEHLLSGSHKKKEDLLKLTKKMANADHTSSVTEDVNHSTNGCTEESDDGIGQCKICEKKFSGPIPYKQHLISDAHKKKLKFLELARRMKLLSVYGDEAGVYQCQDCDRSFCIPQELQQHLESSAHLKKKSRQKMVDKLARQYPEMEIETTAANSDETFENETHTMGEEVKVMICNVCHKSFSGPEAANAHFMSQRHVKAKKQHLLLLQRRMDQKKAVA